jgi:hypothetical protein
MGSRTNFELKDYKGSVWLYSHWGGDSKANDLAAAINHAEPRWFDTSYAMRMVVSYLIKDSLMEETGYGISSYEHGEESYEPMSVDFVNGTVTCQDIVYSFPNFVKLFHKHLTNA